MNVHIPTHKVVMKVIFGYWKEALKQKAGLRSAKMAFGVQSVNMDGAQMMQELSAES